MKRLLTVITALFLIQISAYAQWTDNAAGNTIHPTNLGRNVGIGVATAPAGLSIDRGNGGIHIINNGSYNFLQVGGNNISTGIGFVFKSTTNTTSNTQFSLFVTNGTNQIERMTITKSGNVGIGTVPGTTTKLAVEGLVGAREVRVLPVGTAWPDYVFANTYRLKPLTEVERFINENNHLPDVPSASEVEKEGVLLGEMNATLLKKIEELTLYIIEQNKQLEELKNKVSNLENK